MKLREKLRDRYNFLILIIFILMGILVFKLAIVTIRDGDIYRDRADNTRLKTIYKTAARGEIRDRNGKLLAGTKPYFTVQLLKDELELKGKGKSREKERDNLNKDLLKLIKYIEEDGADYIDEYPILLNYFVYEKEEDYLKEDLSPEDKIINIIIDNDLLGSLLDSYLTIGEGDNKIDYLPARKAIYSLERKGIDAPIKVDIGQEGLLDFTFLEDKDIESFKEFYMIDKDILAKESLLELIEADKTIIRKILSHPVYRQLAYDIIEERELVDNIGLEKIVLSYDIDYMNNKRNLMKEHPYITYQTSGEEDFINLFKEYSIYNFLNYSALKDEEDKEEYFIPGQVLIDMIKEEDKNFPLEVRFDPQENRPVYSHKGPIKLNESDSKDLLITKALSSNIFDEFIVRDDIRPAAQNQLLKDGINPRISRVEAYEYTFIKDKKSFIDRMYALSDEEYSGSIKDLFEKARENNNLGEEMSPYQARAVLALYEQINKQGHRAYEAFNISYGIKKDTVAKISENLSENKGISVSVEPIRYYPEGELGAHILGYLGKISQQGEIEKYINELNYSPNDIIGKTGIEESFESYLRGRNGIKQVEVDVLGNTTKEIKEEKPIPGSVVYLSIDSDLQRRAEEALAEALRSISSGGVYRSEFGDYKVNIDRKNKRPYKNANSGATVAINVKTGEVLAMASYPAYNPNLFTTGISGSDWLGLFPEDDSDVLAPRPLYNIATQTAIQPGSTFKMATALAALDKGMSPWETIRDMHYVKIGNDIFRCHSAHSHGNVNVYTALRDSCNYYFYSLALGKNQRTGAPVSVKLDVEDITNMAKQLGLGVRTGVEINIPRENLGQAPDPDRKISSTKAGLRRKLRDRIDDFIDEDIKDEEKEEIVEEIVSWVDEEVRPSKREVIERLEALGVNSLKKVDSSNKDFADIVTFDYLSQAGWKLADTVNITIGQGSGAYTPLQLANYTATLANKGYRNKLSLIKEVRSYNNEQVVYKPKSESERISLRDYELLEDIKKGMVMVTQTSTGRRIFGDFPVKVAAKTGTAEKDGINPVTGEKYDNFAEFVAFAPADDPEIAVATVIFQGGSGANAGPVSRDLIGYYLGLNKGEEDLEEIEEINDRGR